MISAHWNDCLLMPGSETADITSAEFCIEQDRAAAECAPCVPLSRKPNPRRVMWAGRNERRGRNRLALLLPVTLLDKMTS